MIFRYIGISIVKWIAVFTAISVLTTYVANGLTGYVLALPVWALAFAMAYGFAYWALHPTMPGKRELTRLILIWMVVTIVLEVYYELLTIGQVVFILYSPDLYVQYLLEIIAIFFAARTIRRKKFRSAAGEGLSV